MNRSYAVLPDTCPPWCTTRHGLHVGEEDHVHVGRPLALTSEVVARLCISIDPERRTQDGPYVLVGSDDGYTLEEANALGAASPSPTHLRAHETRHDLVCRLLLEKKKKKK